MTLPLTYLKTINFSASYTLYLDLDLDLDLDHKAKVMSKNQIENEVDKNFQIPRELDFIELEPSE